MKTLYEILELTYYANCLNDKKNTQGLIISKIKMLDFYFFYEYNNVKINRIMRGLI